MALVQNNYDDILGQSLFAQGDAFKQADLNSLYNQQQLEQARNSTLEGQFKNQQSQVMNPLLVDEQKQQNLNLGYTGQGQQSKNIVLGNEAELSTANQKNALSKQAREAVISASDDEMKQLDQHLTKMYLNPETREDAVALEQWMPAMRKARAEHTNAMDKQRLIHEGRLAETQMQTGSAQKIRQMEIDAGKYDRNSKAGYSIEQRIDLENDPAKKMALLIDAANQAAQAGDKESAAMYSQRASALDNLVKLRSPNGLPKAGGLNMGEVTQLPTNPVPSAMPEGSWQAPPAVPAGAVQVGTSGGKPVYELNGKRFIGK